MSKHCSKCKEWKDKSEFYKKRNGLDCYCKKCRRLVSRDRPITKDAEYKARHRKLHPDRQNARYQLQKARMKGLLLNHCAWPNCNETIHIVAHHPDYNQPDIITPLCLLHHRAADFLGDKLGFDLPTTDISAYSNLSDGRRRGKGLCPVCGNPKDRPGHSYCRLCWNDYQRTYRKAKHPKPTAELQERIGAGV